MKFFEKKADLALVVMGLLVTLLSLGALAYKFSEPLIEVSKAKEKSQAAALRLTQQQTLPITPAPASPIVVAMVQPEVAVAPEFVTITIRRGDTLTRVSRKESCDTIRDIVKRNAIKNPDLIFVGQQVKVKAECSPEAGKLKASPEEFAQGVPPDGASQEKLLHPESPTAKVAPAPAIKESGKQIVSAPAPTATTLANYDGPALALPRKERAKKTFDPAPVETEVPMVPRKTQVTASASPTQVSYNATIVGPPIREVVMKCSPVANTAREAVLAQGKTYRQAWNEYRRVRKECIRASYMDAGLRSSKNCNGKNESNLTRAHCIREHYGDAIKAALREHRAPFDARLVVAVILVESAGDPTAISDIHDPCFGLMQLQEGTANDYGVSSREIFDPHRNISGGVRTLKSYMTHRRCGGDLACGLVSYNSGPRKVEQGTRHTSYASKVIAQLDMLKRNDFTL